MEVGVEISFYPLQREEFLAPIRALIERLNSQPGVRVVTNSMSTQLYGEYGEVMRILTHELRTALAARWRSVIMLKLVGPLED
ncbi:MAG TPA: YkoF family thiamine/hydroxymethylpyrimidine-binding protein [Steroidobacteraceae bacterium]|nr:YkoF family thiamine/hydroxymethylpyrimidine-binding protein [Steroidobacteraceae bacterium]